MPREESINLTTIPSNTGREHILYRRKSKFKPSQVDESFFGIKALGEGHSPVWEPTDEVEINKIESEYKRSMMLDYIIPKETDIWSSININVNKPNGETVTLPVKRVRTPIKARHGVNSMVAIEARSRREITQETVDDEKIMTINNSYIPTGAYRENE